MPLFQYFCSHHTCLTETERLISYGESCQPQYCQTCGTVMTKVPSAPAIAFKGGGWYADGYQKPAKATDAPSGS